jgi:hypothetical protein
VWRRESITLFGGAATMSFSLKVVVGILLLVGYSVSASEPKVNGFPTNPDFFPIGIWLQSPSRAANYKAIGINTFVGLHEGPTEKQLAELANMTCSLSPGRMTSG